MNPMLEAELLAHLDAQIALRAAGCCGSSSPRARRSAPATSTRVLAQAGRDPDRDGPPRRPRAGARRAAPARRRLARRARHRGHARAPLRARSPPARAEAARERSAELRGLLAEIAREHGINRALMRQELAFLSHLMRLVGGEPEAGLPAGDAGRRPAPAPPPPAPRPSTCRPERHADLLLLRPPDLAARPARPAARARRHRPQHRQRATPRATRARRPSSPPRRRCSIPAGGAAAAAPARSLGTGVDVQSLPPRPRQLPRPPVPRARPCASAQ